MIAEPADDDAPRMRRAQPRTSAARVPVERRSCAAQPVGGRHMGGDVGLSHGFASFGRCGFSIQTGDGRKSHRGRMTEAMLVGVVGGPSRLPNAAGSD